MPIAPMQLNADHDHEPRPSPVIHTKLVVRILNFGSINIALKNGASTRLFTASDISGAAIQESI